MTEREAARKVRQALDRGKVYPAMASAPADTDRRTPDPDQLPRWLKVLSHFPLLWSLYVWAHGPEWRRFAVNYARWLIAHRGEA